MPVAAMKVLLGHNFYRSSAPSGEDTVYRNERRLLEANGIEVIPFERFNDDIDASTLSKRVGLALNGGWSRRSYRELSALLRKSRPDVAHFHNTFPLISPGAYAACRDQGVPVVQTLHNFRFVCPQAMLQRDDRPCEECLGQSLLPALRHRCYRRSLPATLAQVWTIMLNRFLDSYSLVDRYIALTRFAAGRLAAGGLPAARIEVRPNFLMDTPPPGDGAGGYAVYVGRLSREKGVHTLLAAWEMIGGMPLKIIGAGPEREELERKAKLRGLPVVFAGFLPPGELGEIVGKATLQVIPSEWYEGFPMALLDAYACGTPVAASRIGSLAEIVEEGKTGVTFEAGSPRSLAAAVNELRGDAPRLKIMRSRARAVFLDKYTPGKAFDALHGIYDRVIHDNGAKSGKSRR